MLRDTIDFSLRGYHSFSVHKKARLDPYGQKSRSSYKMTVPPDTKRYRPDEWYIRQRRRLLPFEY